MDRFWDYRSKFRTCALTVFAVLSLLLSWADNSDGGDVTNYRLASFENLHGARSKFNHFTVNNRTGIVYIGAENALYRVDADFEQLQECAIVYQCDDSDQECINYNKILLVDYANDELITCGSQNAGMCEVRDLDDIRSVNTEKGEGVFVASARDLTTEAIIAGDSLFVAATFDGDRYFMENLKIPPMCRRTLGDNGYLTYRTNQKLLFETSSVSTVPFLINYVSSFVFGQFVYFVSQQRMDFYSDDAYDKTYVSKISRVCVNSANIKSYAEIWIECRSGETGSSYNLVQSAHVGTAGPELAHSLGIAADDRLLYAVFSKHTGDDGSVPSNSSAMCVFKMRDVESQFIDAIYGCLSHGNDYGLGYLLGSNCPGYGDVSTQF